MKDAMAMLSALPALKAELDTLPPDFFGRVVMLQLMKAAIEECLRLGVPPEFGAQLGLDDVQARVLYKKVLTLALARIQRPALPEGKAIDAPTE